jgi:hypothetical protein
MAAKFFSGGGLYKYFLNKLVVVVINKKRLNIFYINRT